MRRIPNAPIGLYESLPQTVSTDAVDALLAHARPRISEAELRQAVQIAFVVAARAEESAPATGVTPSREIAVDPAHLARGLGISTAQAEKAFVQLARAGVWTEIKARGERRVRFEAEALTPSPAAGALRWGWILDRIAGDRGAIAAVLAYARLLQPPYLEWVEVSLAEMGAEAGFGRDAARRARKVLVEHAVVEERQAAGQPCTVRFSAVARGEAEIPSAVAPAAPLDPAPPEPERPPLPRPAVYPPSPPPAETTVSGRLRVQFGGSHLDVPEGVDLRLEFDAAGRAVLHVGDVLTLGPL